MATTDNVSKPVLHVEEVDFVGVNTLMTRIITKGVYAPANAGTFTAIPAAISLTIVTNANTTLGSFIAQAKGNHDMVTQRNAQARIVFGLIKQILTYVTPIVGSDLVLIGNSGFDASYAAEAHVEPNVPVISKITEGKAPGTLKVHLKKNKKNPLAPASPKKKVRMRYTLQASTQPLTPSSWANVLEGVSSKDLILTNVPDMVRIWYRVRAEDGKLKSKWSAPVPYPSTMTGTTPLSPTGGTPTPTTGGTPATG